MFRRPPLRLSSLALLAAQLLGLAGLYAADRAITQGARTRVELDAAETAAFAELILASHAQTLRTIGGVLVDDRRRADEASISTLLDDLVNDRLLFSHVWMADSAGLVQYQRVLGTQGLPAAVGVDVDTIRITGLHSATITARQTRQPATWSADRILAGEPGFSIVVPLLAANHVAGFAGGTLSAESLLQQLTRRRPLEDASIAIVTDADTVVLKGDGVAHEQARYVAVNTFQAPGDAEWQATVSRPAGNAVVRVAMWVIGLAMIGALSAALVRERQEGRRVAERSTELERLSTELLRANRAKSEFLANVSHELRTPLNAIVGFVDLLRDGVYGELAPRQVNPVDRIAGSAAHLRHLVDQILDIAKMAAGRMEIHPEPLDLRPFVIDVASEFEALIGERELNLSLAIGGSLPRIRTDPTHLRQILVNLLGNAVKYTPRGGIAVRARVIDERAAGGSVGASSGAPQGGQIWIALQIADSGIGIAPADLTRVFEEFEQVNAGPRGDSMNRGTGLGLPISRRLARLLGGDITVESELGKGSTFTVWIPVNNMDLQPREASQSSPAASDPETTAEVR